MVYNCLTLWSIEVSQVTPVCPHKSFEVSQKLASGSELYQFTNIVCSSGCKAPIFQSIQPPKRKKRDKENNKGKEKWGKEANHLIIETEDKTKQGSSSQNKCYSTQRVTDFMNQKILEKKKNNNEKLTKSGLAKFIWFRSLDFAILSIKNDLEK